MGGRDDASSHCALGFYMRALGFSEETLRGRSQPYGVITKDDAPALVANGGEWLVCPQKELENHEFPFKGSRAASLVFGTNDADTGAGREERLAMIFASHGITINFED